MRWLAGLLAAVTVFCAPAANAQSAPDSIVVGMQLEPPNLDPTTGAAVPVDEVVYATIFEGLVKLGADGVVRPVLATHWDISPDGLSYTFHLRKDVKFSDGAVMDAAAVKFSLERAIAPQSANAQKAALGVIAGIEVLDPQTVRLRLKARDSTLLYVLCWADAVIVSPRTAANAATAPIGTGPFVYASWRRGDSIQLARNPAYWGPPARVARVTFRFIPDAVAALAAVKAGEVDAFPDFPAPENIPELRNNPRLKVAVVPTESETILALNSRNGPLADLRVRRAIAHAIDRQAIINGAMYGFGSPIGSHYPPQAPGYVDLTGLYPHDLTKARALLKDAGYSQGFALSLKLPPTNYARRSGEIVAAQLAQVGIRVTLENLEWAQWLDQVLTNHNFDATIVAHAEPMDYDIYERDYYFGYNSPVFKGLMAELRAADDSGREAILARIQRQIADDSVNAFLFQFPRLGVWDARLEDLWLNAPAEAIDLHAAHFRGAPAVPSSGSVAKAGSVRWIGPVLALAVLGALVLAGLRFGARYLAGRLAVMAATLLAASLVIFLLLQIIPGDPAAYMMGLNANPQATAALRAQLGLDAPAAVRYLRWIADLARGDFGVSYTYRVPVGPLIAERLQVSGPLSLYATLLSLAVALPVGAWAAARRNRLSDTLLMGTAQFGVAVPNFWIALMLVAVFALNLRWFAAGGFPGWEAGLWAGLKSLTLPAIALALPQAAIIARVTRSALIDTLGEDYIRTARAKGLSESQALWRHGLRNALIPILTIIGLQVPFLLAGGVIIENAFYLPGLGRLVLQAVSQRDLIVVQGVVIVLVFAVVATNFIVDLAYLIVDPRLRDGRRR